MNKYEIAYDNIKNHLRGIDDLLPIIGGLLRKETSEKPYVVDEDSKQYGVEYEFYCPVCDKRIDDVYYDRYKYCPECGQKLDWSDVEKMHKERCEKEVTI